MKRLLSVILCLLIGTTILADDESVSVAKPAQGNTPKAQAKKAADTKQQPISGPIVVSDPFGAPVAKQQNDKNTVKPQTPVENPFGFKTGQADPFASGAKSKPLDRPFGLDPFGEPPPAKRVSTPRVAAPTGLRPQRASARNVPFMTLEAISESRERIEMQLTKETTFDYLDTPLKDVIDEIALRHGIGIIINTRALEDFGIGTDTPVTISLNGVRLRSALKLMLRELDLTFIIKNEVMQITTPEEAEANLHSRFYSVSMLLPETRNGEYLVELIKKHVAPDTWNDVGGPGAITFVEHLETLVVTSTEDVLHEVDTLLASVVKLAGLADGE